MSARQSGRAGGERQEHLLRFAPTPRRDHKRYLTVKLRGRLMSQAALRSNQALRACLMRPSGRRGRTISSSARGANQTTHHGPLERLLEVTLTDHHCARAADHRQAKATYSQVERAQAATEEPPGPKPTSASRQRARRAPRPQSQSRIAARALGCAERRRLQDDRVSCSSHTQRQTEALLALRDA